MKEYPDANCASLTKVMSWTVSLGICSICYLSTAVANDLTWVCTKGSIPHPHPRGHLHCMDKGDTISSSMSSTSSVMMKWEGLGRVLPIQLGSMLRAATNEWMPGLLTIWKPQRISICCQRCRRSRSAAVTSLRACLRTDEREWQAGLGVSLKSNLLDEQFEGMCVNKKHN